jgi:CheY-like chemotaxis protein
MEGGCMKKRLNVLWVDDEIELLEAFIIFLKEKNVNVISATNGDDAIVLFVNNQIDLIILDEIMPGMDGLSVLAEISKINAEVPVIMLTKSEEEGLMETAISKQINEYLIKPINPNQILMAIKRIFHSEEIRLNRIGQEYSQFSALLSRKLFAEPDFKEWTKIYKEICHWDMVLDEVKDDNLKHAHYLEKRNSNTEFCNYIEENYKKWLNSNDRPNLSYDVVSQYIIPQLENNKTVYFLVLDCLRYDQYLSIEPFIKELFDVELDMYYSILPTATPYSRNSLFSGLLPEDIAKRFPEYWMDNNDTDNSRNRNEHQLLDELIEDLGQKLNPASKYIKVFNLEEGNFVLRKIESYKNERLVVLVYNFLDLIAHHRSKDQILQETIPDEEAFRAFTRHWFTHSSLYEAIKLISKQENSVLVITTDHGSIRVSRATQVIGDRETSITVRYKEGKNLSCNEKHALYLKNPKDFGLPHRNIIDNYIFAKDDYYFVYPNSYHQYQKQYNGTFQHGGISMEEMLLPLAVCYPKKK